MHSTGIAALAMAAAAVAAPMPLDKRAHSDIQTFSIKMAVYGGKATELTLVAEPATEGGLQFVGYDIKASKGTQFFANGTSPHQDLIAKYKGEQYFLYAPLGGDETGVVSIVSGGGYADSNWRVEDGSIMHTLGAATDGLMACNQTINGTVKSVLSFGSTNMNDQVPAGCEFTSLSVVNTGVYSAPVVDVVTFGLAMSVYDPYTEIAKNLTLIAETINGTIELVGHAFNASAATPVFARGSDHKQVLETRYKGVLYNLATPLGGDDTGIHTPVSFVEDTTYDPNWTVEDGTVFHKLGAASDGLMACDQTIDGKTKKVLSFGSTATNGSEPYGCDFTTVYTVS